MRRRATNMPGNASAGASRWRASWTRASAPDAVRDIAALIRPGMTTRDAVNAADAHLRGMGASHNWHPTYVRFGVDTQSPAVQPTDFQRAAG